MNILRRMMKAFAIMCGMAILLLFTLGGCRRQSDPIIMSYEQYRKLGVCSPYTLRLTDGRGELFYFGVEHTACPSHPQLIQLEQAWSAFCPDIAFSEGGVWPLVLTRDEAISNFGEGGLLRFLAHRDSVPIFSLEPSRIEEVLKLRREFEAEEIKLFYVLRQVVQYRRGHKDASLDDYTAEVLQMLSQIVGLEMPPRDLVELENSCHRYFPDLKDWRQAPAEWFDPTLDGSIMNRISRAASHIRDVYMAKLLTEEVKQGRRVFAVVGYSHVVMQENALRQAIER